MEYKAELIKAPLFSKNYVGKTGILYVTDEGTASFRVEGKDSNSPPLIIPDFKWIIENYDTIIICDEGLRVYSSTQEKVNYFFIFDLFPRKIAYNINFISKDDEVNITRKEVSNNILDMAEALQYEKDKNIYEIAKLFLSLGDYMRLAGISNKDINAEIKQIQKFECK